MYLENPRIQLILLQSPASRFVPVIFQSFIEGLLQKSLKRQSWLVKYRHMVLEKRHLFGHLCTRKITGFPMK